LLLIPVPLGAGRMRLPVLLPVIGALPTPLAGALTAGCGILGIGSQPGAVILAPPLPLTLRLAANGLVRLVSGGLKCLLAKPATPLDHEGVVAFCRTVM
jgi:hypothetical protein